jgi:hypothetical protein
VKLCRRRQKSATGGPLQQIVNKTWQQLAERNSNICCRRKPSLTIPTTTVDHHNHDDKDTDKGASFQQTVVTLNENCMGTGCLALPLLLTGQDRLVCLGMVAIAVWNVYAVQRLGECLQYVPNVNAVIKAAAASKYGERSDVDDDEGTLLAGNILPKIINGRIYSNSYHHLRWVLRRWAWWHTALLDRSVLQVLDIMMIILLPRYHYGLFLQL